MPAVPPTPNYHRDRDSQERLLVQLGTACLPSVSHQDWPFKRTEGMVGWLFRAAQRSSKPQSILNIKPILFILLGLFFLAQKQHMLTI